LRGEKDQTNSWGRFQKQKGDRGEGCQGRGATAAAKKGAQDFGDWELWTLESGGGRKGDLKASKKSKKPRDEGAGLGQTDYRG